MVLGVVGRPGCPHSVFDLDVEHYLWFVEGLIRELNPANEKAMDELHSPAPLVSASPQRRVSDIEAFLGAALG